MKKFIVLLSSALIVTGAIAQTDKTDKTGSNAAQSAQTDRKAPVNSERERHLNQAAEPEDSANSVSTDFQGSSSQATTSSGMGQPKKDTARPTKTDKTEVNVQDVEDKTKK